VILLVAVAVFASLFLCGVALYFWMEGRRESLAERFRSVVSSEQPSPPSGVAEWKGRLGGIWKRFAPKPPENKEIVDLIVGEKLSGIRLQLNLAGYRSARSHKVYWWTKILAPALLVLCAYLYGKTVGIPKNGFFLLIVCAAVVGYVSPILHLKMRIRRRQQEITDALPDALDLLVVCVEAGLGINASFVKITEEFHLSHPVLSKEFDVVNREMVAGKPRQDALRSLAERTGVEDVQSLVAMLIQTEKLGTSLARSLRVHSDSLRTKRRQRAEEAAAKTTIKLVFPLVFLMFPALFIVVLGPGFITILKVLFPAISGGAGGG